MVCCLRAWSHLCKSMASITETRRVNGMPTFEVIAVIIWYILKPDLGHQMVMVMNNLLQPPLYNVNSPSHSEIQLSMVKAMCVVKGQGHIWPWKFKGQGHGQGHIHWSHLKPGVQSICLLFYSRQSDHFWLRYSKFYIWPWKFKVKVMAKVKPDGHIWGLKFNRYIASRFEKIRPFLAEI